MVGYSGIFSELGSDVRLTKVSSMYRCLRKYSGFITASCEARITDKPFNGLLWLGNMSEGGNAGSAGSAVSEDLNHPVNTSLPSGTSPSKIRMGVEIIAIDNDAHMDNGFIVLTSSHALLHFPTEHLCFPYCSLLIL